MIRYEAEEARRDVVITINKADKRNRLEQNQSKRRQCISQLSSPTNDNSGIYGKREAFRMMLAHK